MRIQDLGDGIESEVSSETDTVWIVTTPCQICEEKFEPRFVEPCPVCNRIVCDYCRCSHNLEHKLDGLK